MMICSPSKTIPALMLAVNLVCLLGCGGSDTPGLPVISKEPLDQQGVAQGTVTFVVTAKGLPAPTGYQWRKKAAAGDATFKAIPGATAPELVYGPIRPEDQGSVFDVEVGNRLGKTTSRQALLTLQDSTPVISGQPSDVKVEEKQAASFTVDAYCPLNTPLTYQWQRMEGSALQDISGAVSDTYRLASVGMEDHNAQFQCVVSNGMARITSRLAHLEVQSSVPEAPYISGQPQSATVSVGARHTMSVSTSGSPIPTLKWMKDGQTLPGQTGRELVFSNVQPSDAGTYTVEANNPSGTVMSQPAVLSVEAKTFTVTFKVVDANGTVDGKTEIVQSVSGGGSALAVTAQPLGGYKFNFWAIGNDRASADPVLRLENVTSDMVVTAHFTNQSKLSIGALGVNVAGIDQTGKAVNLCDYYGSVILLDVSTQWCGPCKEEAPKLETYHKDVMGKGVKCLTVLTQNNGYKMADLTTLQAWVAEHSMTMRIQNDAAGTSSGPAQKCYVAATGGFPTMVVLDKEFRIKYIGNKLVGAKEVVAGLIGK